MNNRMVSICIPSYNSAHFLAAAIDSALQQQYPKFEILIVDDCSTDGSRAIGEQFERDYPQTVRFVANESNLGMVANWNKCLNLARGEYIKYLFGDDLLSSPHAISKLATVLECNQEVTLACSYRKLINKDSILLAERGMTPTDCAVDGKQVIRDCLTTARNFVGEPTAVMFRKQQAARGFDPAYSQLVDLEMWCHLLLQGASWCCREPLAAFRLHDGQQTAANNKSLVHLEEILRIYDRYLHASNLRLPFLLEKAIYYVQCYRIWKGYRQKKVFDREYVDRIISKYIDIRAFIFFIPLYKLLNPIWKMILSWRSHNPFTRA